MLKKILNEFMRIAAVPRPSHHEERIAEYLCRWAETHNLFSTSSHDISWS